MADLCAEVVKVVEPAYENRHLTIETEIEDTVLTVNRELLVTALVNLMDNARKASEEGQQVEVTGKFVDNIGVRAGHRHRQPGQRQPRSHQRLREGDRA